MKKRIILIVLPILLVLALLASPVLAKDSETPDKGLLWETIAGLQEQIENGLAALAQQLSEGLGALQQQIDGIQAYLDEFEETDPVFGAMDTEAELETQVGENILTEGEDISLLNNDAGYITEGDIPAVSWGDISGIPAGFADGVDNESKIVCVEEVELLDGLWPTQTKNFRFRYELPANHRAISASGYAFDGVTGDYLDPEDVRIYPYFHNDSVVFYCRFHNPKVLDFLYVDFYYTYCYIHE